MHTSQYCQEVVLEHVNSVFSPVTAMHIWWDNLEFGVPPEGDGLFVCCAGLIVKNLEINQKNPGCQACHNGIVGCNLMAVAFRLECLLEDEIAISVEGNHYCVLVPQACSDWQVASVIHVQPAEGVHHDEDLVGWHIHGTRGSGRQCWRCQGLGSLGLVDPTFWHCWARYPKIVLLVLGKYLATLENVRPLEVLQFPALMASNHGCLTGKPRQAW
jgi:hypothetical protein